MLTYKYVSIIFSLSLLNLMVKSESITPADLQHEENHPYFQSQLPSFDDPPPCDDDGLTFCENVDSYPYDHIKDILDENPIFKTLFATEEQADEITDRLIDERNFVCKTIPKIIYPKIGKTKDDQWRYIINQDDFVQSVRVEVCRKLGGRCDVVGDFPEDIKTSCKQKYVFSSLLSLDEGGLPTTETFQIPSACCCVYKRNLSFSADDV